FLEAWEESHEDQARWLARYTLVSPRQAYALQYRVQTLRDLYATAVAGLVERDFRAAVAAAGETSTGETIQLRMQPNVAVLRAQVPLSDEPADLYISR
ncbi:MAG: hypothetical protein AAF561_08960, partial [Planctomycetota bacterium]